MRNLDILIQTGGLALTALAWFDPLGFGMLARISMFILGFDMMGIWLKAIVIASGIFIPILGGTFGAFSWTLLLIFGAELLATGFDMERPYFLIVKPSAAFIVAFFACGLEPALVVGGADLAVNLVRKMEPKKAQRKASSKRR
jgi:hypothetical protein